MRKILLSMYKKCKIVTEFWPIGLKRSGIDAEEYLKLLIESGFKLYEVNEEDKKLEPVNIRKLLETYTSEKGIIQTYYVKWRLAP